MAKIYLKGRVSPLEVASQAAEKIKDAWLTGRLSEIVSVGDEFFKRQDLKGISLEKTVLADEELYSETELLELEKRFANWVEQKKDLLPEKSCLFFRWLADLGIIKVDKENNYFSFSICDIARFEELSKKYSALKGLRTKNFSQEDRQKLELAKQKLKEALSLSIKK